MRVAITGTTGRVGSALAKSLKEHHVVVELPRAVFDLSDSMRMKERLDRLECDVLINPAGLTNLEACEDDPTLADRLNREAPGEMAAWAERHGVRMIHFSTDYVFGGDVPGYRSENDRTDPLSCYGLSKKQGEEEVLAREGTCVVRVSWVFGPEKTSFIDGMIRSALACEPLQAVADKFSLPTSTHDLSEAISFLLEHPVSGIMHVCQSGEPVSWHGMARVVVDELFNTGRLESRPQIAATRLADIASFRAPRPRHSAMATDRLTRLRGHGMRNWEDALRQYVRECR